MADTNLGSVMDSLFKGMDSFVSSKTVVGEVIKVNETTSILPLIDVSFGLGAGAAINDTAGKNKGGGGLGAKMSPNAVLIVQNGTARIVNVKEQDRIAHLVEMIPDVVSRLANMGKKDPEVDAAVDSAFDDLTKQEP